MAVSVRLLSHPSIHPRLSVNSLPTENFSVGERIHDHDFQSLLWRMHASSRIHPSIHPSKDVNKFFPATEKPFGGGKSMQTKRFKIYGGECTRLASIHPSIHPKLFINSTPRQKMFQSARAGKPKNWILYGGECAPLTSIHPSVHPSIHPSIQGSQQILPGDGKTFPRGQEHANQKVQKSMAASVRLLSHPSIHPRRVLGKLFLGKTNTLQRATRQTGCSC